MLFKFNGGALSAGARHDISQSTCETIDTWTREYIAMIRCAAKYGAGFLFLFCFFFFFFFFRYGVGSANVTIYVYRSGAHYSRLRAFTHESYLFPYVR